MNNPKSPFKLVSAFAPMGDQISAIKEITEHFSGHDKRSGPCYHTLLGVTGSGKTFTMANVIERLGKKTLILAPNKTLAGQLFAEFKEFFPHNKVEYFVSYYDYYRPEAYVPSSDTYIEKDSAINDEIDKLRHSTTRSLIDADDVIVVASVSCIYGLGSPEEYQEHRLTYFVGDEINRKDLLSDLIDIQFKRNDFDLTRGCFRVLGDIVDIFPSHEDSKVIRLEFFDTTLENIRIIDPLTQKTAENINKVSIYPMSHYVIGRERLKKAIKTIQSELKERLISLEAEGKLVEKQRLEMRTRMDLEMLAEMGVCSGIENYSRHFTGQEEGDPPPTLLEFFGDDFLLMVDESHIALPQVGAMYKGDRSRKMNLVDHGFRLPSALDNRPLKGDEFMTKIQKALFVSATPAATELALSENFVSQQLIRPTGLLDPEIEFRQGKDQVQNFLLESRKVIKQGFRILATTLTKKLAEELASFYSQEGLKVRYLHSEIGTVERLEILKGLREGEFDMLIGINLLREGLDLPEVALVGIFDADKEGFLRSVSSLVQTIGRAARNSEGRVILYGHKKTKNIVQAMEETSRRRDHQIKYNKQHNITPTTIIKEISGGIIEILSKANKKKTDLKQDKILKLSPNELKKHIEELKKKMKIAASELRFEEAARIRDEIKMIQEIQLYY